MGIIGYTCTKYPDTMLSIIFLPFFAFKAGIVSTKFTHIYAQFPTTFRCVL